MTAKKETEYCEITFKGILYIRFRFSGKVFFYYFSQSFMAIKKRFIVNFAL